MPNIDTSDLIRAIKEYQNRNVELLQKSHHFVFDCPLDFQNSDVTDYIWIGLNPGNDEDDWFKTNGRNDEETRDSERSRLAQPHPLPRSGGSQAVRHERLDGSIRKESLLGDE